MRPAARAQRAPRPGELPPARAVAGALVAVSGVALGIGALLWATEAADPAGPVVRPAQAVASQAPGLDEPAVEEPAVEVPAVEVPAVEVPGSSAAAAPALPTAPAASVPLPPPAAEPAPAPSDELPLLVLNNSRIDGLAQRTAQRLEAGGWPVRDTGSLRGRIRATTVYYEAGQEAAARELARRFPWVQRVLPRLATLPGEGLTLVVTRDAA